MTAAAQETQEFLMEREFLSTPAAAGIARHAAARALITWGLSEEQAGNFLLVISELVTNAINARKHRAFKVRICEEVIGTLTIEVWDPAPEPPRRRPLDLQAEDGRGLLIVDELAAHYGWRPAGTGKWVFAVLEVPHA
ncbi:ATP-binding protein [Actinomadura xylanilytica]|uniref:ATP-binding protein n=1 Tax=Actinomadura xylanilytica TaxID=887459 RepID=UPI00255B1867|nr:ATP-binding protein [Actinomadura xylanilytica]MDL4770706.1 ATP-binding protein [Actinomadura xylanilytica]